MRIATALLALALLAGCSRTVLVPVPPRMDLGRYAAIGVIEFASDAGPAIDALATREFQARIHAAQPGTPLVELGSRPAVLAAVGAARLDAEALRRIGAKYEVDAVFTGEIEYAEKTDVKVGDLGRLEGGARVTLRGDAASRLLETRTGASVWSVTAWATRQVGRVSVSAERGVRGAVDSGNPREQMVPTLVYHLTQDFRPTTARRRAD